MVHVSAETAPARPHFSDALHWDTDGAAWPNRASSRFVTLENAVWHVQIMGRGPDLLLLHGTGAATHSWRGLMPLLAKTFRVIAPDLPGHGFTGRDRKKRQSLPHMAQGVGRLMDSLDVRPTGIVGHSAGAAIGARMVLDKIASPEWIVSLNGALLPFPGMSGVLFPALARLIFLNPFAAPIISRLARDPDAIRRLIRGTGSSLDPEGLSYYQLLLGNTRHVESTIEMMANWNLAPLQRDFGQLEVPLKLFVGTNDAAVPPTVAYEVKQLVPDAEVIREKGLGHLAHEEDAERLAALIREAIE